MLKIPLTSLPSNPHRQIPVKNILITLLIYNLDTIQFTHLECTIQCYLVYSQGCVTTTTI